MFKLRAKGLKWLKGIHLIAVSCWVGGGVALVLMYFLKDGVTDGGVLYGINQSIHYVDRLVVVIPGAFGCLLTGLAFSIFSNWGFFRQNWMIFKWIATVAAILFGTFFLGPWEREMLQLSGTLGMAALCSQEYLYNEKMHMIFGTLQVLVLMIVVFVSIFKPWKSMRPKEEATYPRQ